MACPCSLDAAPPLILEGGILKLSILPLQSLEMPHNP
jgi:hypothetical protein